MNADNETNQRRRLAIAEKAFSVKYVKKENKNEINAKNQQQQPHDQRRNKLRIEREAAIFKV